MLVITVIFAWGSVAGSALASAMPASPVAMVDHIAASAVSDLCEEYHPAKAPTFKPCGKKVNGKVVECHQNPIVMPTAAALLDVCAGAARPASRLQVTIQQASQDCFRPPRDFSPV